VRAKPEQEARDALDFADCISEFPEFAGIFEHACATFSWRFDGDHGLSDDDYHALGGHHGFVDSLRGFA